MQGSESEGHDQQAPVEGWRQGESQGGTQRPTAVPPTPGGWCTCSCRPLAWYIKGGRSCSGEGPNLCGV